MKSLIKNFYASFSNRNAKGMIACYHDNIVFEDPAFGVLEGERAKAMWQMLLESQKGKDFKITYSKIKANEETGSAHWEAYYTFSETDRKVHNKIEASFEFKDNLIIKHTDEFSLRRWAKQAMGIKGIFFGGIPFFKRKLQQKANETLDKFIDKKKSRKN